MRWPKSTWAVLSAGMETSLSLAFFPLRGQQSWRSNLACVQIGVARQSVAGRKTARCPCGRDCDPGQDRLPTRLRFKFGPIGRRWSRCTAARTQTTSGTRAWWSLASNRFKSTQSHHKVPPLGAASCPAQLFLMTGNLKSRRHARVRLWPATDLFPPAIDLLST